MVSRIENNLHILKLQKGDKVREEIEKYVTKHQLGLSKIEAIGMLGNIELGYLNKKGTYDWKTFTEGELISFLGNVAWDQEKATMHAHASLGDHNYQVFGGHFGEAIVTGVMEVFITEVLKTKIERKHLKIVKFKTWDL